MGIIMGMGTHIKKFLKMFNKKTSITAGFFAHVFLVYYSDVVFDEGTNIIDPLSYFNINTRLPLSAII